MYFRSAISSVALAQLAHGMLSPQKFVSVDSLGPDGNANYWHHAGVDKRVGWATLGNKPTYCTYNILEENELSPTTPEVIREPGTYLILHAKHGRNWTYTNLMLADKDGIRDHTIEHITHQNGKPGLSVKAVQRISSKINNVGLEIYFETGAARVFFTRTIKKYLREQLPEEKVQVPQPNQWRTVPGVQQLNLGKPDIPVIPQPHQWFANQVAAPPAISEVVTAAIADAGEINADDMRRIIEKFFPATMAEDNQNASFYNDKGIHIAAKKYKVMDANHVIEIYNTRMMDSAGQALFPYIRGTFVCIDFATVFHAMVKREQLKARSPAPFAIAEAWNRKHVVNIVIVRGPSYGIPEAELTQQFSVLVFEPQDGSFYIGDERANFSDKNLYDAITWVKF